MKRGTWQRLAVLVGAIVVLAAAGVAAQTTAAAPQASTVKVGIIYSRTGLLSNYGAMYEQGLRLGLQYLTKGTNKVNGHKIDVTFVDDGVDPAKAVTAAKDLIGQGYKIIAGSTASGVALQVGPIAEQNKVLFISGPAASDAITGLNRYTFRSGRQTYQDILATKEVLGKGVGKKILVFAQDTAFGQGNYAAVNAVLGTRGHTVSRILVPLSASDFTPFATQAKNAAPDLLFIAWAGTTTTAVFRALEQQGALSAAKETTTGLAERSTWSQYPPGIDFFTHYVPSGPSPKNKINNWLIQQLKRKNQAPDLFTVDGFTAAQMIVRAVQKTGGDDVDKMIGALEGWQFVGPKGVYRIRQQDHALLQPMFQVRLVTVKGKRTAKVVKIFAPGNLQPPITPFKS
jgi:branched-chain amino acid transport system substrate-binding protein